MAMSKEDKLYCAAACLSLLAVLMAAMLLSGFLPVHENPYNSYTLQAQAWLNGQLDLGRNYPWLELAVFNGGYYVSFPPFPSFVLLPFILIFGADTPDHFITLFFSMVSVVYAYKLAALFLRDRNKALFISLFLCAGSNYMIIAIAGGVWFIAQNMAFALTLAALYYAAAPEKPRFRLSLFLLACAVGCRPFQAVYAVLICFLFYRKMRAEGGLGMIALIRRIFADGIPALLLGCGYMALNCARFGNPFEFGHNYLPEFLESPNGQFSLSYLWGNIQSLFRMPGITETGALDFPMFNGVAVWLVFPIILSYAASLAEYLIRRRKSADTALNLLFPALIILHVLLLCAHKTMGGFHFGHRYINDCMPAVAFGLILLWRDKGDHQGHNHGIIWHFPLFLWGVAVNIYGAVLFFSQYM